MATPQTPQPASRSVLKRYAPFIAVVVVLAVVGARHRARQQAAATTTATTGRSARTRTPTARARRTSPTSRSSTARPRTKGTLDQYTWQQHCDTDHRRRRDPDPQPAACVPAASGDNGGATSPGVTGDADQDRLLHPQARPDVRRAAEGGGRLRQPRLVAQAYSRLRADLPEPVRDCTGARSSSSGSTARAAAPTRSRPRPTPTRPPPTACSR